jgi:hypothetical protein
MQRGTVVGVLAWSRISVSPRAPASFCADPSQIALGHAFAARVMEATRLTAEATRAAGLLDLATRPFEKSIRDVHALTTRAIARFLVTGQGTTETERNFIGRIGFMAARCGLSLTVLTQSYILWRDTNLRVLNEEVTRLRTAVAVSDLARLIIRSSADTGILRMARAYDEAAAAIEVFAAAPPARDLIVSGV